MFSHFQSQQNTRARPMTLWVVGGGMWWCAVACGVVIFINKQTRGLLSERFVSPLNIHIERMCIFYD